MMRMWGSDPTANLALLCRTKPGLQLLEDVLWRGGENLDSQTSALVESRNMQISMQVTVQITQSFFSLTWRARRRLGESEGLSGAMSKQ